MAKRDDDTATDTKQSPWPTPIYEREIWPVVGSILLGAIIGALFVLFFF